MTDNAMLDTAEAWVRLTPVSHQSNAGQWMRKVDGKKFQYEFAIPNLTNAEALAFAAQLPAVKALVWALEQVQWVDYRDEDVCPVCGSIPKEGHTEECIIATALAPFTEAE